MWKYRLNWRVAIFIPYLFISFIFRLTNSFEQRSSWQANRVALQGVNKFHTICGSWSFITMFTRPTHLSLSWVDIFCSFENIQHADIMGQNYWQIASPTYLHECVVSNTCWNVFHPAVFVKNYKNTLLLLLPLVCQIFLISIMLSKWIRNVMFPSPYFVLGLVCVCFYDSLKIVGLLNIFTAI